MKLSSVCERMSGGHFVTAVIDEGRPDGRTHRLTDDHLSLLTAHAPSTQRWSAMN